MQQDHRVPGWARGIEAEEIRLKVVSSESVAGHTASAELRQANMRLGGHRAVHCVIPLRCDYMVRERRAHVLLFRMVGFDNRFGFCGGGRAFFAEWILKHVVAGAGFVLSYPKQI